MTYRIEVGRPLSKEVRRIAVDELDAAMALLRDPERKGLEGTVHSVRKRTKKLRSLIRIVRPALGPGYAKANGAIREASGLLSPLRDSHALVGTFDVLVRTQHPRLLEGGFGELREALTANAETSGEAFSVTARLNDAATLLRAVRDHVEDWSLPKRLDLAIDGAAEYYGQARLAFQRSVEKPSEVRMHEWRKRVKDNWYHTQLLRDLAPQVLAGQMQGFNDLSDGLGDNNDLSVLTHLLTSDHLDLPSDDVQQALLLIADVQRELVSRCHRSAARIYVEGERTYQRRLRRYAAATERFGSEETVGGLDAVFATDAGPGDSLWLTHG